MLRDQRPWHDLRWNVCSANDVWHDVPSGTKAMVAELCRCTHRPYRESASTRLANNANALRLPTRTNLHKLRVPERLSDATNLPRRVLTPDPAKQE